MKIIAERLKELREDKGLYQKDLSDYLKMDRSNYSKYERDVTDPSIHVIIALAKFYNVTTDYLLGLSDDFSLKDHNRKNGN